MNRQRLNRIEKEIASTSMEDYYPVNAWREEDYLYISKSPFILERLQELGRDIVEDYLGYPGIRVSPEDTEVIESLTETEVRLRGMSKPIGYMKMSWTNGDTGN